MLGLDEGPAWIVVSDHNVDEWPNPGLATLPGKPERWAYGFIPPALFAQVRSQFIALAEATRSAGVMRTP